MSRAPNLNHIRYATVAAEHTSFNAAARALGMSVPALTKAIQSLEANLGAALFHRSPSGIKITPAGARYVNDAKNLLQNISQLHVAASLSAGDLAGTLAVSAQTELVSLPWVTEFHELYPTIQIALLPLLRTNLLATDADAYLLTGWPDETKDLARAHIAQSRFLVCATPSFWLKYGVPYHPRDLTKYPTILHAIDGQLLNDFWTFEAQGEVLRVTMQGWLLSPSRLVSIATALRDAGLIRMPDLLLTDYVRTGRLVPVLKGWNIISPPPLVLMYKRGAHAGRIKLLIDHLRHAFGQYLSDITSTEDAIRPIEIQPEWSKRHYKPASLTPPSITRYPTSIASEALPAPIADRRSQPSRRRKTSIASEALPAPIADRRAQPSRRRKSRQR